MKNPIPGFADEWTLVDQTNDSIYYHYRYPDSTYCAVSTQSRNDIKWDTQIVDSKTTRYVTSINSNRIELLFDTKSKANINPLPYYGKFKGTLKQMIRNGLVQIELGDIISDKNTDSKLLQPSGIRKTGHEISNIKRERMVITTHVFENEQICWGKEKPTLTDIPFDTTLHYAGGTLILKRLKLPKLPAHYQTFVELRQRSNGDAYDRTGSVFVIPNAGTMHPTFLDAILYHPDSLPTVTGKNGERYQGIVPGISQMQKYTAYYQPTSSFHPGPYFPPVELMRFFTPFGVGKFNDRVRIDGLEWNNETFYKQEVTDLKPLLEGEVWIGCFIGNYDGGGHIVSLDIKSYPNDYEWTLESNGKHIVEPLVNTCNVLEMAGQNYGRIFGTDSLTVSFWVAESNQKTTLRYISTGHGGWGGGDEFNPKENEIFIDGQKRFSHTPWRCDCGRYREWNPVSGNFWNGLSSSDLSRSGWCPGTATQPVYFDLTGLKPGNHTLTIAIPQGKPMEGGFSHWNVSATLIIEN
ncbi:MAG: hypothetical protein IJK99_01125 [Bacteroidales bacterium]|nr:hypothetical protein [Bacteroidales bacterium]